MKIRSITLFIDDGVMLSKKDFNFLKQTVGGCRDSYEKQGYEVQSMRLVTPSFALWCKPLVENRLVETALSLEEQASQLGFQYLSLGSALPEFIESYDLIPVCLAKTKRTFFSGVIATKEGGISLQAVRACSRIIHQLSKIDPNGFGNLYFTALANVQPLTPFFPSAYGISGKIGFGLALEAADLAVQVCKSSKTLDEVQSGLIREIESHAQVLTRIAKQIEQEYNLPFAGIDFTLAPYVVQDISLGYAIEQLGIPAIGLHGSVAAAAFITSTIDRAKYPHIGFNGLMLPVLEDYQLALRTSDGSLSIKDLLLYSCVCGTGLDTIPLPGDVSEEALRAVLLDVATLSLRLRKQLTARLMPIPGKKAGEMTHFDFPFFCNTRVMQLEAQPLVGLFGRDDGFRIYSRYDD